MRVCCLTGKLGQKTKFDPQDVFVCQREVHQKTPSLITEEDFPKDQILNIPLRYESVKQRKKREKRTSRPDVFCEKDVLRNLFSQVFSCEFCQISKNTFSYRTPPVAA